MTKAHGSELEDTQQRCDALSDESSAVTKADAIDGCSGGLGQIDHGHLKKLEPEVGMLIVKIGGPAYRIGMGGGAASSIPSGSNKAELDFNAVQVSGEQLSNVEAQSA